jgi:hypothetical protein
VSTTFQSTADGERITADPERRSPARHTRSGKSYGERPRPGIDSGYVRYLQRRPDNPSSNREVYPLPEAMATGPRKNRLSAMTNQIASTIPNGQTPLRNP